MVEKKTYVSHSYRLGKKLLVFYKMSPRQEHIYSFPPNTELRPSTGDHSTFLPEFFINNYESYLINHISAFLRRELKKVYYLSAERGSIPWTYGSPPEEVQWVGRNAEHTLGILAKLMSPEYQSARLPYELLCEEFGMKNVWAGWQRQNYLTSGYRDPLLGSSHKLPSLGYGSKQLLSVIVQLAYAKKGSIVLVEEPEVSLHPGYQRLLPVLFGEAIQEGKQVIVTSHSSYFPLSLGLVLKGYELAGQTTGGLMRYKIRLSKDDIAVYHVARGKEGHSKVKKLPIDEDGLKEGIPSFTKVEREILSRFINKE